jgi:hypothetical protein
MTTSEEVLKLKLDGPGELLETLPYLLGFHPSDSVVLVGLDDARLVLTTRVDLTDAADLHVLADSVRILLQARARMAIVVIYAAPSDQSARLTPSDHDLPHQLTALAVHAAIEASGLRWVDTLLVQDGHWWSYPRRSEGRPGWVQGTPLPGDRATGPATAVYAGRQAYPSRRALEAVLEPEPVGVREDCRAAITDAQRHLAGATVTGRRDRELNSVKRALFAAARESDRALFPRPATVMSARTLARFAVGPGEIAIRDALWLAIDQQRLDGRGLWLQLLQRVPSPDDAAPLFLFGWATWRDGNGTLASIAAQRALQTHPGYPAAELLLSAVVQGLDPFRTPKLRAPGRS